MKQYPDGPVPSGLLESEPPCALVEFVATSSKQVGFCQLNVRIGYSFDGHKQVIKFFFVNFHLGTDRPALPFA